MLRKLFEWRNQALLETLILHPVEDGDRVNDAPVSRNLALQHGLHRLSFQDKFLGIGSNQCFGNGDMYIAGQSIDIEWHVCLPFSANTAQASIQHVGNCART